MNQQLNFRYNHTDRSRVFRDLRSKPVPEITQEQCYFLGFRISIANDYLYHHALILADDHDSFNQGIKGEYDAILSRTSATYTSNIALVFVRNLLMQDPALINTVDSDNFKTETQKILSKRDDNQFTVLGMRESKVSLVSINTSDALTAFQLVRSKIGYQIDNDFKPLEVCQAHPVTKEFDALFQSAAKRIKCLIGNVPTGSSQFH
jgi:hypothetical protein